MNELFAIKFSLIHFLEFLVGGLFLWFALYLVYKTIYYFRKRSKWIQKIYRFYPLIFLAYFVLFLFISAYFLLAKTPIYFFVFFLLILLLFTLLLKRFILDLGSRIILSVENYLQPGARIRIGKISGEIKKVGLFSIRLIQADGSFLRIPCSRLAATNFFLLPDQSEMTGYSFRVDIDKKQTEALTKKIRSIVYSYPWTIPAKEPSITRVESRHKTDLYEITVYTIGNWQYRGLEEKIFLALQEM